MGSSCACCQFPKVFSDAFFARGGRAQPFGNIMRRILTLAAATAAGITTATTAHAAQPPVTVGPPVVVTTTRFADADALYPVGVSVITAQDIERSPAATVPQLLQSLAGIRTRDLSGSPNAQVDMRGFGIFGDQNTLVLLDGVRISEYEQLTVNWSAIPLASIERIEILRGGGTVLYGSGATGGTINIITKAPQQNARSAYIGAGVASHNTREVRGGASLSGENVGLRAHASHYESDNYRDNNRVRIDNAQADLRWTGTAGSLVLKLAGDDQRNGLPGAITEAKIAANRKQAETPNDFATARGGSANLAGQYKFDFGEFAANFGYREKDTTSSFFVGTPFRNNVDTHMNVWTLAPRLKLKPRIGSWDNTLVLGADVEDWKFDANAQPSVVGRPHATQRSEALYAQHTMSFATQTTLALGVRGQRVRYDVNDAANASASDTRNRTLRAWDISLRQVVAPGVNVYGKLGQSFRLPNVNDNYNLFAATVTLLEPQTAHDTEVGVEGTAGPVRYRAAAYRINLRNEIFFDPLTFSNRNLQPTRRQGLELEARWQVTPAVDVHGNYTYADAKFREGDFAGVSIAGNAVPLVPRHAFNAGLGWAFAARARADFDARHVGSSPFDGDETNTFGRKIPAYTVADLKLSMRSSGWLFNAGVRNLFNHKYFSYGVSFDAGVPVGPTYAALPAPERTLFVSAQYTFQ
jgi:iron complex outermembrane receptor protein